METNSHSNKSNCAKRTHEKISIKVSIGRRRVRFSASSAAPQALNVLKKNGFRKPFFANQMAWIRQIIVDSYDAYMCLAENIRLDFIIDGDLVYWNGYGERIDYKERGDQFIKAGYRMPNNYIPHFISFDLGLDYQPFVGLLDGLTTDGRIEETEIK